MDLASLIGIAVALVAIFFGMSREGGSVGQILQPTAALIVLGGTLGAVMLQFPLAVLLAAARKLLRVFWHGRAEDEALLRQIVAFAFQARREGLVSLDNELPAVKDAFFHKALMLAIDGTEPDLVRQIMRLELDNRAQIDEAIPSVFEAAGGYAPTIGIIGAVLGLIQVMKNLDNIDHVGPGIATAFVATIYGVALANLFCLPIAGKLKVRQREEVMRKEMILEGVVSILEGMNPRMVETKLRTYLRSPQTVPDSEKRTGRVAEKKAPAETVEA